jgi:hypothetical protein
MVSEEEILTITAEQFEQYKLGRPSKTCKTLEEEDFSAEDMEGPSYQGQ